MKRKKAPKGISLNSKPWVLIYDPKAHSENEIEKAEAYIERTTWDIYNIRESLRMLCFHEGIIFLHMRSKTLRAVVEVENGHLRLAKPKKWQTNMLKEKMATILK